MMRVSIFPYLFYKYCLDPPYSCRRRLFLLYLKYSHILRILHMRTTTELTRIDSSISTNHRVYLYNIRILFPETSLDTRSTCLIFWLVCNTHLKSRLDSGIHIVFYCLFLFICHFFIVSKVKSKTFCCNIGSCLVYMISENFS